MAPSNDHPGLSPLMIPQNTEPPYSQPKAFSSVEHLCLAQCDTIQTPFFEQPDHRFTSDTLITKLTHEPFDSRESIKRTLSEGLPRLRNMLSSSPKIWRSSNSFPLLSAKHQQRFAMKAGLFASTNSAAGGSISQPFPRQDDISANELQLHLAISSESKAPRLQFNTDAHTYSSQFPAGHHLNPNFAQIYQLEDQLGSGGYGFVMTAYHRIGGHEVAVKFIIKDKVPEHAWMEDEVLGRLPTEVVLLSFIKHENIVKCLDLFEDHLYFYLVQELHGSPWLKHHKLDVQPPTVYCNSNPSPSLSTPALSPSSSETSLPASEPTTPPHMFAIIKPHLAAKGNPEETVPKLLHCQLSITRDSARPEFSRRPSHDLFECIEQSEHKRLTEVQARYVFAQVVDAVQYLDNHGITHRDIKDENLVIDQNLKVKLIDFGSAISVDPSEPRPYYKMFYGTAAYASSEILLKKSYQAAPAEIWTLGVLLSYLLAGVSPFPSVRDAVDGKIFLSEKVVGKISDEAMDLLQKCLDPNPESRATICQVKGHPWLQRNHLL